LWGAEFLEFKRHTQFMPTGRFAQKWCNSAILEAITFAWRPPPMSDDDFEIRPGRVRDRGRASGKKAKTLAGRVLQISKRAGYTPRARRAGGGGTGRSGRGRSASLAMRRSSTQRRVVIKARVVRHKGASFRAAPLARHLAYLKRDGVDRDGTEGRLFDATNDSAEGDSFAERCEDDRHHFRFIVSPEDATQMEDLRAFTRELMDDMAHDLGTRLDWVAVDHWNTDNPHIHILVRGKADGGRDLVIDRDYIREGMRGRAEERVTAELGHRTEREIEQALRREVGAERWTNLDRSLQRLQDERGVIDLRPDPSGDARADRALLIGRATELERLGLATAHGPACWTLGTDLEGKLRDLGERGDIIKTMHRAMSCQIGSADTGRFAMHDDPPDNPIIGRLVERGLHDELAGSAYAIVDGVDGHVHHLKFSDLEMTSDAEPGAIVELRSWEDDRSDRRHALAVRSDLALDRQIKANGATWLDRQLVAAEPLITGNGFGAEVERAKIDRAQRLADQGLGRRQGTRLILARNLIPTLRDRELADAAKTIAERSGLDHTPTDGGDRIKGIYRERIKLASGRFALIENVHGFELVPWKPSLDRCLGAQVSGAMKSGGGIEWSIGRARGIAI
jgi:type IV secretory pathway VirD2 relaxase